MPDSHLEQPAGAFSGEIRFRNLLEGRVGSMHLALSTLGESDHSFLHMFLSALLKCCFAADLLRVRGFLSVLGSLRAGDVFPSAAAFASLSACLLPSIPT